MTASTPLQTVLDYASLTRATTVSIVNLTPRTKGSTVAHEILDDFASVLAEINWSQLVQHTTVSVRAHSSGPPEQSLAQRLRDSPGVDVVALHDVLMLLPGGSVICLDSILSLCQQHAARLIVLGAPAGAELRQGSLRPEKELADSGTLGRTLLSTGPGSGHAALQAALNRAASAPGPACSAALAAHVSPAVLGMMTRYGLYGLGGYTGNRELKPDELWRAACGWHGYDSLPTGEAAARLPARGPPTPAQPQPGYGTNEKEGKAPYRIGVLGGSFNPPTVAHIQSACTALSSGQVDEVWLVPCGPRPDKPLLCGPDMPTTWQRHVMTYLALEDMLPAAVPVRVMPLELAEPIALASYELMDRLERWAADLKSGQAQADRACGQGTGAGHGQAGWRLTGDVQFHLIIGADLVPTLHTWRHPEVLLASVRFLALPRPGYERGAVAGQDAGETAAAVPKPRYLQWIQAQGSSDANTDATGGPAQPPETTASCPTSTMLVSSTEVRARVKQAVQERAREMAGSGSSGGASLAGPTGVGRTADDPTLRASVQASIAALVPPSVASYIARYGLYT